ncbi:DUF397 domain-containing protein [Streptomyces sp. NPDC101175]|uniref:DUF397 domain-containing protein n=1 Tax=Streptomyces sp. NPDC101175 TaxID=3366123 RepID=UPI0038357C00
MITPDMWRKSSFSGGGQGDACVEIAHWHPRISVRDSKIPSGAVLTLPAEVFSTFVEALKGGTHMLTREF